MRVGIRMEVRVGIKVEVSMGKSGGEWGEGTDNNGGEWG